MDKQLMPEVMVVGVKRYNFSDRQTGEILSGTSVYYYEMTEPTDKDTIGFVTAKTNLPYEHYELFQKNQIPGIYEPDMTFVLRGNKPSLKINGFKYLRKSS